MKILGAILSLLLMGYLHWLIGLPIWASMIIVALFIIPPICFYTNMALCFVYMFISIAIHVYTIVFAFMHTWWKGILTAVLPGISEVYWFTVDGQAKGFRNSLFCTILLWYVFGLIMTYVMPIFLSNIVREASE